ncbi:MAG TPA: VRR-NUC domain-containing protein [Steroidobacteraceae bacterium]|nr:VRR-NUC domain-containing protein [Steroidobacteraceae bacterium]
MRVIEPFYYLDNFRSMLELIEVEAPGDRLQESQRRCFEFLLSHQVPVSLCRVRWNATVA